MDVVEQHTSGAQRQAEAAEIAAQREQRYARLRARVDELAHEVGRLASEASSHGAAEALVIAINAREARGLLERAGAGADHEVAVRARNARR